MSVWPSPAVRFIHLDIAHQPIPTRPDHSAQELVQSCPRGLIATQSQFTLQPHGTNTRLLTGHRPHGAEPRGQRSTKGLEDGSRGHRRCRPHAARCTAPARAPASLWLGRNGHRKAGRPVGAAAGTRGRPSVAKRRLEVREILTDNRPQPRTQRVGSMESLNSQLR